MLQGQLRKRIEAGYAQNTTKVSSWQKWVEIWGQQGTPIHLPGASFLTSPISHSCIPRFLISFLFPITVFLGETWIFPALPPATAFYKAKAGEEGVLSEDTFSHSNAAVLLS